MPKYAVLCADLKNKHILELGPVHSGDTGWEARHGYASTFELAAYFKNELGLRLLLVHDSRAALRTYLWQNPGATTPISKNDIRETSLDELDIDSIADDEIVYFVPDQLYRLTTVMDAWRIAYEKVCRAGKHVIDFDAVSHAMTIDKVLLAWLGQAAGVDLPETMLLDLHKFAGNAADAGFMVKIPGADGGQGVMRMADEQQLQKLRRGELSSPNARVQQSIDAWKKYLGGTAKLAAPAFCLRQEQVEGCLIKKQENQYDATTRIFYVERKNNNFAPMVGWHKLPTGVFEPNKPGTSRTVSASVDGYSPRSPKDIQEILARTAELNASDLSQTGNVVAKQLQKLYAYARSQTFNDIFRSVLAQADAKPIWFEYAWRSWAIFWACEEVDDALVQQVIEKITTPAHKIEFGLLMLGRANADVNAPLTYWAETFSSICSYKHDGLHMHFRACIAQHLQKHELPAETLWWKNDSFVEQLRKSFFASDNLKMIQTSRIVNLLSPRNSRDLAEACRSMFILSHVHECSTEPFTAPTTDIEKLDYIARIMQTLPNNVQNLCMDAIMEKMRKINNLIGVLGKDDAPLALKSYTLVGNYLATKGLEYLSEQDSPKETKEARVSFARTINQCIARVTAQGMDAQNPIVRNAQECLSRLQDKFKITLEPMAQKPSRPRP